MFREYFVMGERQCYPVTGDVSLGELAFAEPLAVALHAVNRAGDLLGKSVLVTGAGTIGCLTVMAARLAGATQVTVSDILDRPLAKAREVGADAVIRADREPDALASPQFDVAFEVSGSFAALKACVAAARKGARIVQVGTLPHEPLPFVVNELMAKELDLCGAFRWGIEFDWAVRYLSGAARRRAAAADRTVSAAGCRRGVRARQRQDAEHEGPGRRRLNPFCQRFRGGAMKSMQKLIRATAAVAVAATLLMWRARPPRRPSSSGRTSTRPASRTTRESVWAADEIKKRTNGKFDIQVFPASSLGKETDINQGLSLGTVDMIISGPSFAARSYPRIGIAYYPFIFRDADHLIAYSKSPVFEEMVEGFREKTGIQITAYTYYGARQTTSNRPFTDCAGMKGLKIRVPDVPAYMATPKACGANPTPIAFAEVYLALQNGTVEAQENPLTTIEAKKFYEVQKAIMLTGHIVDGLTTQIAPHVWNKLTDDEKKIFTEVTREAAARATAQIKKREAELVDEFKKKGLQIVNVNRKSFVDAVLKNATLESMGYERKDYDRIVAIK